MRPAILTVGATLVGMALGACNGDAPAPPFEACGEKTAKISGRLGMFRFQNKPLEFDENSTTEVTITVPSGSTSTALDDVSTSGATSHDTSSGSRSFTATGMNTLYDVTVTGTINADCTGSGNWRANSRGSGTQAGRGTWKIE